MGVSNRAFIHLSLIIRLFIQYLFIHSFNYLFVHLSIRHSFICHHFVDVLDLRETVFHIDGFVQERRNSIALAMALRLFAPKHQCMS